LLLVAAALSHAQPAAAKGAIIDDSAAATTLSSTTAGASNVTYTFSGYEMTGATAQISGATIVFADGTKISEATLSSPAGRVQVSGQTLTVTFVSSISSVGALSIIVGGITNPTTAESHAEGTLDLHVTNNGGREWPDQTVVRGAYTITPAGLTLSVTSGDIDFGSLDPGTTPPVATVKVNASASAAYSITRQISGDNIALNLTVSGSAAGSKTAGTAIYTDSVTISPGWDATPGVQLTATILYTAVMP